MSQTQCTENPLNVLTQSRTFSNTSDIHKCTHRYRCICIPSEDESDRFSLGTPENTSAPRITHFQPSESSAVKLFEQPWVLTGNLITVWFRSSNSAYHPLSMEFFFNIFKCMLTLRHRRPRNYCILDKNHSETWRDLHIVWHAMDGWITACVLMSFQQTPCMFQRGSLQIPPAL